MSPASSPDSNFAQPSVFNVAVRANLALAGLGIVLGLMTQSHAVLLDGVMSLGNGAIAWMFLQVDRRLSDPPSDRLPFGDAALEPLLELLRGAIALAVWGFAALAAVASVLGGGRSVLAGVAVIYGALVLAAGMGLAAYQGHLARRSDSPLADLDARHWFIEGAMGGAIAIAFAVVFLAGQAEANWVGYVDPLLVLGLAALSVSEPWQQVRRSWRQLLERSTDERLQRRVRGVLDRALKVIPHEELILRVGQFGRLVYVQIYIVVAPDNELTRQVLAHDRIRHFLNERLNDAFPRGLALDIAITSDRLWALRAIRESDNRRSDEKDANV